MVIVNIAPHIASAGVGHITLVDCDVVVLSNLNRQVLHWEEDIGEKKPLSAARKLAKLNPTITITPLFGEITTIIPTETPCLACIFPTTPKKEGTFPVFSVTPAFIAALQAAEAIKLPS